MTVLKCGPYLSKKTSKLSRSIDTLLDCGSGLPQTVPSCPRIITAKADSLATELSDHPTHDPQILDEYESAFAYLPHTFLLISYPPSQLSHLKQQKS
jgi:hypothetical protein